MSVARDGRPASEAAADKRRSILAAAARVFARQGFQQCRVADIADEAGVAYGLVYHYFRSKDAVLDELFSDRWALLVRVIGEVDAGGARTTAEEKLGAIARFIVGSYRSDPELMKVVIVDVTRAANTFGRTHFEEIDGAYGLIAGIVERAQAAGELRADVPPRFAALAFYGAIEQVLTTWIFDEARIDEAQAEEAAALVTTTVCGGLLPR